MNFPQIDKLESNPKSIFFRHKGTKPLSCTKYITQINNAL